MEHEHGAFKVNRVAGVKNGAETSGFRMITDDLHAALQKTSCRNFRHLADSAHKINRLPIKHTFF
jgi:hypothetical protein